MYNQQIVRYFNDYTEKLMQDCLYEFDGTNGKHLCDFYGGRVIDYLYQNKLLDTCNPNFVRDMQKAMSYKKAYRNRKTFQDGISKMMFEFRDLFMKYSMYAK